MPNPQPPLHSSDIEKFRWETAARFVAARIIHGDIYSYMAGSNSEQLDTELAEAIRLADQLIAELSKPPNEDPDF